MFGNSAVKSAEVQNCKLESGGDIRHSKRIIIKRKVIRLNDLHILFTEFHGTHTHTPILLRMVIDITSSTQFNILCVLQGD